MTISKFGPMRPSMSTAQEAIGKQFGSKCSILGRYSSHGTESKWRRAERRRKSGWRRLAEWPRCRDLDSRTAENHHNSEEWNNGANIYVPNVVNSGKRRNEDQGLGLSRRARAKDTQKRPGPKKKVLCQFQPEE
jgi:hypothetical protein